LTISVPQETAIHENRPLVINLSCRAHL